MNFAHLKVLREGVIAWNAWRKMNPDIVPDLSGADLSGMDLRGINFSYTDLRNANLSTATNREQPGLGPLPRIILVVFWAGVFVFAVWLYVMVALFIR